MQPVHDTLLPIEGTATKPLRNIDPDAARQEFMANGQGGLDELLAALDGGFEVEIFTLTPFNVIPRLSTETSTIYHVTLGPSEILKGGKITDFGEF